MHPRQAVRPILDAHSKPDVRQFAYPSQAARHKLLHPCGALGENLIRVPVRSAHDIGNLANVGLRHSFVEQVAHRVDEDPSGCSPAQRLFQLLWHQPEIEALLKGVAGNAAEPLSEGLGIAVLAAGADLRATAYRVPGCVGPLDAGSVAH